MKPLLIKDISNFIKRFGNFVDGEFRDIDTKSPTDINLTFSAQDANRGFDWITITFEFKGISEAALLDNSSLLHVDMSNGLIIEVINNQFTLSIKNSTFFITSSSLKYQEGLF